MERVKASAMSAQISGFIDSLSDGYDTTVGEHGFMLSEVKGNGSELQGHYTNDPKFLF